MTRPHNNSQNMFLGERMSERAGSWVRAVHGVGDGDHEALTQGEGAVVVDGRGD